MKYAYTEQQLIDAVNTSYSYRVVLEQLNIVPAGGNYTTVRNRIKKLNIDTSHFSGKAANKGKTFGPKRPLSDYLTNKQPIQSFKLKKRLLREKIFEYKCYNCQQTTWLNELIPLELHHKDGDNSNNQLENLELLYCNCHALTSTYRGKNI